MVNPVIVTGYFDLSRMKDSQPNTRSIEFYRKVSAPTLTAPCDMVIFCDQQTRPFITEIRNNVGSKYKTYYIEKELSGYDLYFLNYDIIDDNRRKSNGYKDNSYKGTVSHFLVYVFKMLAIKIASMVCPDASHFIWLDFGASHVVRNVESNIIPIIKNPHPKIGMAYIHHRSSNELSNVRGFLEYGNPTGMAASSFSVSKDILNTAYSLFFSIFHRHLSIGYGHSDEAIFTYMYDEHPELFTIYYGDYYSVVSNYHYVVEDFYSVKQWFIGSAIKNGREDLAKAAALKCLESINAGYLSLEMHDILWLSRIIHG